MTRCVPVLLVLVALGAAARADAQVFTPSYLAPRLANDIGVYVGEGPGDPTVEGILRRNFGGTMLGFRLGIVDRGDASLSLGGEILSPLAIQAPISLALTAGGQAIVGDNDDNAVGLTLGLNIGGTLPTTGFSLTPYIHPRLGVVNYFGGSDEFDLDLVADVGVNLDFRPGISLRLGVGISDVVGDWGLGVAWRQ